MSITFQGLGSGLQIGEIVEAIVGAEKVPYESRLNFQEATTRADISAAGSLKSALEDVQNAIAGIADADKYQLRTVKGADDFISITSSSKAGIGTYDIRVDVLASAHKLVSEEIDSDEAVGEGSLSFTSGENTFTINVSATETLAEIRDKINDSTDNETVNATIITDDNGQRLVFSSKETGVANAITVTVDDVGDNNNTDTLGLSRLASANLIEATQAIDAQITIDNTVTISSSTNEFINVIDGIDITAKKVQSVDDGDSQVSITEDNSNIEEGLEAFVSAYNKLVDLNSNFGQVGKGKSGVMIGDSLLRGVMSKIRNEFTASFDFGSDGTLTLSELGIRSDQYGKMSIDSDVLNEFIHNNVDNVQQLLVGTESKPGFAGTLTTLLDFYTKSDGLLQGRIDSKELKLDQIDDDREAFTRKMDSLEARLYTQYNAMDLLVAGLNATSTYLMAQLDNMPGVVRNNN
ncbi:flagellar filament capping protein FliD [Colwellia sp. TT2012]|uniref:flagellar filament capping protein FliD n=1 Tax=Colwellia sp. TT2012 TaxID=1720342 RepID=UPI00070DEFDA|nr:flagellar filament capping protein FliD [Colwellia sp. TT2012]